MALISLKSCDILYPRISLYYKGLLRHSSNCSGLLSILSVFLIIFFSFYFSKEIYDRKNPTAYYYNRFIENIHPFYFNSSGIFHSINLYSYKSNKEINRLFSIIGV